MKKRSIFLIVLLAGFSAVGLFCGFKDRQAKLSLAAAEAAAADGSAASAFAQQIENSEDAKTITKLAGHLLINNHYRKQALDGKISDLIFEEYIKLLDVQKYYFTQEDLKAFEAEKSTIGEKILAGDASIAFKIYDIYRQRFSEFHKYAEQELKKEFDFAGNDFIVPDRRKLPRAQNMDELRKLWHLKLKSDVLYYRLLEKSMASGKQEAKDAKDNGKKTPSAAQLWGKQTPQEKVLKRLRDIQNSIDQQEKMDILGIYLTAAAQVFGPHSSYYPPKLNEDFDISMKLSLIGIGATLASDDGYIKVVDLVPGGPADKSGALHAEDRIIAVAQENSAPVDVVDMTVGNAVKMIRGPEGSKVTLTILPGSKGRNAVPENVTIVREKVLLKDSEAKGEIKTVKSADGKNVKIGIIELPSFYMDFAAAARGDENYKSCTRDVAAILANFTREGVEALVLDFRTNGGGSLPEAITLTGLFIPTGPVVQIRDSKQKIHVQEDRDSRIDYMGPLLILTSKGTASAAEIVSGALKDCGRAIVVGDSRTFGKGTVLDVVALERLLRYVKRPFAAGSLKYETAMFYRINGDSVQQLGIKPDILLPSLTENLDIGEIYGQYCLPWDKIGTTEFRKYDFKIEEALPGLMKKSEERIAKSPKFKKLLRETEYLKKQKEKNQLSLNENRRWKEYLDQKKLVADDELAEAEEQMSVPDRRKKRRADDMQMEETLNIAADYVTFFHDSTAVSARR